MITVKVRSIMSLKEILGQREVEVSVPEGSILEALLLRMVDIWGEELRSHLFEPNGPRLLPYIRPMINGQDIAFLGGMETVLKGGDDVLLLPPVGGG